MGNDAFDQLRAANPVPDELANLPIDRIRIADNEPFLPSRNRRTRGPELNVAVISMTTALTLAIAAVAAVALIHSGPPNRVGIAHRTHPPATTGSPTAGGQVPLTPVTAATARAAGHSCGHAFTGTGAAANARAFAREPVLIEGRGIYTALVAISDQRLYVCLTSGHPQDRASDTDTSTGMYGKVQLPPGPDLLSVPYALQTGASSGREPALTSLLSGHKPGSVQWDTARARLSGGGYGNSVVGQAGSDVSAITFTFANGDSVVSTIEHGWYFAWWPWVSKPLSILVTTPNGTTRSSIAASTTAKPTIVPLCQPRSAGCVFTARTPGSVQGSTNG